MNNIIPVGADSWSLGGCGISIEHAGPDFTSPSYIPLVPDDIRGMAGDVIASCVAGRGGLGGFVTKGLASVYNYIAHSGSFTPTSNRMAVSCLPKSSS